MVLLTTSDDQKFHVEKDVIERSVLVRNMLDDIGENDEQAIPLLTVTGPVFKKVIEYCERHRGEPLSMDSSNDEDENRIRTTQISEWDQKYIPDDQDMLVDVILAANESEDR